MKINFTKLSITAIAAFLLAALIGGCKKDDNDAIVGICPLVISTNPANLAINVPLNQIIDVTFNKKMDPASFSQASFSLFGGAPGARGLGEIAGTVSYDDATASMRFKPTSLLTENTTYNCKVYALVKDLQGNVLQTDYLWSFKTGIFSRPSILSTNPANNATGVPLNQVISATFSIPIDPSSVNSSTFILNAGTATVAGTVSYNGTSAIYTPTGDLLPNTLYSLTLTSGIKDTLGNVLLENYIWSFTTGTLTSPFVIAASNKGNITNAVITVDFSEAMNPVSITGVTFIVMQGTTSVAGVISYSGTTATFTPSGNLIGGATYTVTVFASVVNLAGTPMISNFVWSFVAGVLPSPNKVNLKSVARFGIIAGVGVSNQAGFSEIRNMDVGISPGVRASVVGFPPATIVNGAIYASDDISPAGTAAMLTVAQQDLKDAYLFLEGASNPAPATVAGDQGGKTLAPGIYKTTSTLLIQSGNLTLDAQGDTSAVWIFQIASAFTTVGGAGGNVILIGGAQAKNIYWQVGSSATIGDYTSFKGNILALTSITMNTGAVATGRMLARNGSVVMTSTNIINKP